MDFTQYMNISQVELASCASHEPIFISVAHILILKLTVATRRIDDIRSNLGTMLVVIFVLTLSNPAYLDRSITLPFTSLLIDFNDTIHLSICM